MDEYGPQLDQLDSLQPAERDALIHKLAGAAGSLALGGLTQAAKAYGAARHAGQDLQAPLQALQAQINLTWQAAGHYLGQDDPTE